MKAYIAEGRGHYLGWYAVIFAADEAEARRLADTQWFDQIGKFAKSPDEKLDLREIPMRDVHVIFNGDY